MWFLFRPKHNTIFSLLSIEDCPSVTHMIYDLQQFTQVWLCTGVATLYSREISGYSGTTYGVELCRIQLCPVRNILQYTNEQRLRAPQIFTR